MTTSKIALLFIVVVAVLMSVESRRTHCDRWKGDSEFRCAKDNYRSDSIHIRNVAGRNVAFKVGKWISTCGRHGDNYADEIYTLGPGHQIDVGFNGARNGECNEFFIYDCRIENRGANCIDTVVPSPN